MNKTFVLSELTYAREYLTKAIQDIEGDDGDGFGQFHAQLPFIYRHLNLAWNGKMLSDREISDSLISGKSHPEEWLDFPQELEIFIRD
jgi:hypothetical protein